MYHLKNFEDMADAFALELIDRSCNGKSLAKTNFSALALLSCNHRTLFTVIVPVEPAQQGPNGALPEPIVVTLKPHQFQQFCFEASTQAGATIIVRRNNFCNDTIHIEFFYR